MGSPQGGHLQRGADAAADASRRRQLGQPWHVGGQRFLNGQLGCKTGLLPAGKHRHSQQGGGRQAYRLSRLQRRRLGRAQGHTASAGMHRDQLGTEAGGAAAGAGHGGRDVVELEIEEHPLALVAQLLDHSRPASHEQLQTHLHPAQLRHARRKGHGLLWRHAIEGHDDLITGLKQGPLAACLQVREGVFQTTWRWHQRCIEGPMPAPRLRECEP